MSPCEFYASGEPAVKPARRPGLRAAGLSFGTVRSPIGATGDWARKKRVVRMFACRDAEGTRTEVAVPIRPLLLGAAAHRHRGIVR